MDFAPAHTAMLVSEFLAKNKTEITPQPPYSLDLACANFFIFPKLKTPMKGKGFATIEQIKEKSKQELLAIPKKRLKSVSRIGKNAVLYLRAGYFEGVKIVIDK